MNDYYSSYYNFNTYQYYVVVNDRKRLLGIFDNEHDLRLSKYLSGNGNTTFPCKTLEETISTIDIILNKLYKDNSLQENIRGIIILETNKFHNLNNYKIKKDFSLNKKSK